MSELDGIYVQDILLNESKLHIRNTKTYKEWIVPIQSKMKTQLLKYIQIRGVMDTDALFVTYDGEKCLKGNFRTE
ncbi:hypothetical protein [Bacillus safensis]|uniref:hypothetical protein n=1 Tax=Bacillus safensis TaxID=561879 RepID=UPI0004625CFD